ncbi:MAG: choice-of-anchor D domain-containing protein [Thermoanaerobaculia bacterium]|nr:choice-of-anchor D domain-containing protein [Thermoanaerobaculia bacterium]
MVYGQEIVVKGGNGVAISNGDVTPVPADQTDFGWTTVAAGTITRTFIIENTGSSPLTLSGGTPVTLSGPHAGDFSVTTQPSSPVIPLGSTSFEIVFDPSAAGMRNATVSIANNDCDEAPFTFDITGKGTIPQAISVFGNGNQIANQSSTASVTDDTDFGSVSTGGGMVSHTFTINNIVNGSPLLLTGVPKVTIADRDAADFTVTTQPSSPVDGGGSTTFTVKFQPSAAGLRTAIVIITHNDLPENPFVFTLNGTGL